MMGTPPPQPNQTNNNTPRHNAPRGAKGGSILASLPSFGGCWLSAAEYDEHGAALIHAKMP
jgi:actin-related protein